MSDKQRERLSYVEFVLFFKNGGEKKHKSEAAGPPLIVIIFLVFGTIEAKCDGCKAVKMCIFHHTLKY